jgi:methyltransferase (TIGR00027 family)
MQDGRASVTADGVAMLRAVHQLADNPKVFDDPLAVPILGVPLPAPSPEEVRQEHPGWRSLRAHIVGRSRHAEEELKKAVHRGATQYVILGSGLDTFAYRNPYAEFLRVYEVDFPSSQARKLEKLKTAGIQVPSNVSFIPVDFEHATPELQLRSAGFRPGEITCFSWLGVTCYLTDNGFSAMIDFIAGMPEESSLVFDFFVPKSYLPPGEQAVFERLAAEAAALGEPYRLFFEPHRLVKQLSEAGFRHIDCLDRSDINRRYFGGRSDDLRVRSRLIRLLTVVR